MDVFWFVIGVVTGGSASTIAVSLLFHRIRLEVNEGEPQ